MERSTATFTMIYIRKAISGLRVFFARLWGNAARLAYVAKSFFGVCCRNDFL